MTMFKEQRITCDQLQVEIGEAQLIEVFIGALNVEVFGNYKEDFTRDGHLYPNTLNELFVHTNNCYITRCQAMPMMANVLGDASGYAVYSTYWQSMDEESAEPAPSLIPGVAAAEVGIATEVSNERNPRPVCQLCDKVGHSALTC